MYNQDYAGLDNQDLLDLIFYSEDRLEAEAAHEIARRQDLFPPLVRLVVDKQSWMAELPSWWGVVHATYILGLRGGREVVLPLLLVLRWSDAFDCDWVTEALPAIFGRVGRPAIARLTKASLDPTAGWSARDLALKSLAAISLTTPSSSEKIFQIIGQCFMDEYEDRLVRQLAGQILLDFRHAGYRMALSKFAREAVENWHLPVFTPEDVDAAFRSDTPAIWHYNEDWMRFYTAAEVQRRQKRWVRERLGYLRSNRGDSLPPPGGGRLINLWRHGQALPPESEPGDPEPSE